MGNNVSGCTGNARTTDEPQRRRSSSDVDARVTANTGLGQTVLSVGPHQQSNFPELDFRGKFDFQQSARQETFGQTRSALSGVAQPALDLGLGIFENEKTVEYPLLGSSNKPLHKSIVAYLQRSHAGAVVSLTSSGCLRVESDLPLEIGR